MHAPTLHSRAQASPLQFDSERPQSPLRIRKPMATSYGISYFPVSIVVHVLGVVAIALVLTWNIVWRGGVSLSTADATKLFNAHPVIMTGGFIFIYSEALLVYKTLWIEKKSKKLVHLILQAIAFLFALVGVWAAYKNHLLSNVDNFYSLHSWMGILTLSLFFIQWLVGFFSFFTQSVGPSIRASVLPWHVFFGLTIYGLAIATAAAGYLEKLTFLQTSKVVSHYEAESFFVNSLALLVIVVGIATVLGTILPAPKSEGGYQPLN